MHSKIQGHVFVTTAVNSLAIAICRSSSDFGIYAVMSIYTVNVIYPDNSIFSSS